MWIINAIINPVKTAVSRCRGSESGPESSPLLAGERSGGAYSSPAGEENVPLSFSQDFTPFQNSSKAVYMCLAHLTFYFVVAAVAYSYIFEKWHIVESIYFGVVVFTTIGYGDLVPSTDASRLFTVLFALYGIGILSALLSIIGKIVIEMGQAAMVSSEKRARRRLLGMFATSDEPGSHDEESDERNLCQEILRIIFLESPVVFLLILFSVLMGIPEGRTVITSIYYAFITALTIGFGDFHPTTTTTRAISIFFLPFAVAVFGEVLSRIAGVYLDRKAREADEAFLQRELALTDLVAMDVDKDGKVSYGEFLSFMLVALDKVDKSDLDEIRDLFDKLDIDNNGFLEKNDLVKMTTRRKSQIMSTAPAAGLGELA